MLIRNLQLRDTSNASGYFEIEIPSEQQQNEYPVTVLINDTISWEKLVTPSSTCEFEILLQN